jgi:lipoprotein-releasing system permease protein
MYKLLLSWRYLKTRFIALASIVSVTLGVATLIVVNSVMAGFVDQMKSRLHGILSDVEVAAPLLGEITYPQEHVAVIRELLGDEVEALTCVVRNPALLSFEFHGRQWTQQVMLMGIDDETFGKVTDFEPYLTNELKRQRFSFELEENGYEQKYEPSGWEYRRRVAENKKQLANLMQQHQNAYEVAAASYLEETDSQGAAIKVNGPDGERKVQLRPLPSKVPQHSDPVTKIDANIHQANSIPNTLKPSGQAGTQRVSPFDPHANLRPQVKPEDMFDAAKDQYTGIILGQAISQRKTTNEAGEIVDLYMVRPGDDVQIMFPSVGSRAQPVSDNCTVVDFYSSNMHEYDSTFAFMPLSALQDMRGMIDPLTGDGTVSTIQIKLKEGADLDAARDKLIARFPPSQYPYDIHTWQDTQRPLLSAVTMELTILNILLFLIIAVAGFGILATFFMIVVEKTRDIGILKALGAPSQGVMSIFLGYGMSLGTVGTSAGIVLGLLFIRYINEIADLVAWVTGQEVFDPTIYYFSEIPTIVSPLMVFLVAAGAIGIAVLASVLPALRAARLHPVEALRYE